MIYYAQCNHGVSLQNFEISTKEKPPAKEGLINSSMDF